MQERNEKLLRAAADFLWSDQLQKASDQFIAAHAPGFANCSSDGEQLLEWQPIYLSYCQIYESALEGFVASQRITLEEFVDACQDAMSHSKWNAHRGLAECICAMSSYEYFINMMMAAVDHVGVDDTAAGEYPPYGNSHTQEETENMDAFL
jgi:hypothetical protein